VSRVERPGEETAEDPRETGAHGTLVLPTVDARDPARPLQTVIRGDGGPHSRTSVALPRASAEVTHDVDVEAPTHVHVHQEEGVDVEAPTQVHMHVPPHARGSTTTLVLEPALPTRAASPVIDRFNDAPRGPESPTRSLETAGWSLNGLSALTLGVVAGIVVVSAIALVVALVRAAVRSGG
jgi:hypothetical protein